MSPGTPARSATSSGVGAVMKSSSAATLSKRSGRGGAAVMRLLGERRLDASRRRRRHRPHGREVHVGGDGEAGAGERARAPARHRLMRRRAGPAERS